ncbi:MAG: hypothetical protein ACTSQE_15535 [Candidatus Heimdallarchaeaceae archaeon]
MDYQDLWNYTLTQKLISLLKLKPLLDIKDLIIHNESLKEQYKHYDPLAIALKILNVIVENMGPFSGITKNELVEQVLPLLRRMDKARNIELLEDEHIAFIDTILEKLLFQTKREGVRIRYTDYSSDPPIEREHSFRLIGLRNYEGEKIVIVAETATINLFLQMLEIDLEDQQQALLHVLSRQIRRGDLDNALSTAQNNLLLTKQYMLKVEQIIHNTRRNLSTSDWDEAYPKELKRATAHIKECIATQTQQINMVREQIDIISWEKQDEIYPLIQLKESLTQSLDLLLPLQKRVSEARETFLNEQWVQELFKRGSKNRVQLESMLLEKILAIPYRTSKQFIDKTIVFFTHSNVPEIVTFDQLVDIALKRLKQKEKAKEIEKTKIKITKPLDLRIFSSALKKNAVSFLREQLEINDNQITLKEILEKAESENKGFLFCNYLRLLIQGRNAKEDFERSVTDLSFKVQLCCESFDTQWFSGDNYLVIMEE